MRVGVLSDIHANLPALEVALDILRADGAEAFLSAGDVVGYGPHPAESIDRLQEIGAVSVAGNHELYVAGSLPGDRFGTRARETLEWTAGVIGEERLTWLASLPRRVCFGPIVLAHGSLEDPTEYVVRPRQGRSQLRSMAHAYPDARILVLGHTHQPLYLPEVGPARTPVRGGRRPLSPGKFLVNPGSVGQSRQWERHPRTRFALVDLGEWWVQWYAAPYDHLLVEREASEAALPPGSAHFRPAAGRALTRSVRLHTDLSLRRSRRVPS